MSEPVQANTVSIVEAGTVIQVDDENISAVVEDFRTDLMTVRHYQHDEFDAAFQSGCKEVGRAFVTLDSGHTMWCMDVWSEASKAQVQDYAEKLVALFIVDPPTIDTGDEEE